MSLKDPNVVDAKKNAQHPSTGCRFDLIRPSMSAIQRNCQHGFFVLTTFLQGGDVAETNFR